MARSRRSRRRSGGEAWKILVGILAFVVALGIGGAMIWLNATVERPPALDAATLCPVSGPTSLTVVLVDASDALPEAGRTEVATALRDIAETLPRYGLLELRLLDPADPSGRVLFSRCNPGNGEGLSEWTANPEAARRRWTAAFHDPLVQLLDTGLPALPGDVSPIMATIQRIALERFDGAARADLPKRLVVVSDMIENTPDYSQYRGDLGLDRYRATRAPAKYGTDLAGADATLYLVVRAAGVDPGGLAAFWQGWFAENGGRLVEVVKLQGEG